MGCVSSKILTRTSSFREELQKHLQGKSKTASNEEIVISKNLSGRFVAVLCSTNTAPTDNLKRHESFNKLSNTEESKPELTSKESVDEPQQPENKIETINSWELLAGLEDEDKDQVGKEVTSKILDPVKDNSEPVEKGSRRKAMAKDLAMVKLPTFEFSRTGSLRDWLSEGGQVLSPGSYVTPRFGISKPNGGGEGNADEVFDSKLVAQFEKTMEKWTIEEDEIISHIV